MQDIMCILAVYLTVMCEKPSQGYLCQCQFKGLWSLEPNQTVLLQLCTLLNTRFLTYESNHFVIYSLEFRFPSCNDHKS